ncbi:hypothetical protein [Streptomyces bohaiensis]|uniref:hypothetical protein n=1 Tax=Streptomyces bohaiensis TaxID=1431344 RepID=UPI003B7C377C
MPTTSKPTKRTTPKGPAAPDFDALLPALAPRRRPNIRRRLRIERGVYTVAAAGIGLAPVLDAQWPAHATVAAAALATGGWLYHKAKDADGLGKLLRAAQRAVPVLSGAALYAALFAATATASAGWPWWQVAGPAAWAALMAWTAPITRARTLAAAADGEEDQGADPNQTQAPRVPATYPELLAQLWEESGIAPGTRLADVQQIRGDRPDFDAVIVAPRGRAVPKLEPVALAAVFDVPEGTVTTAPVHGSGPGRVRLVARPTLSAADSGADPMQTLWAAVTRPGGPTAGVQLLRWRSETDRLVLQVAAPAGQEIRLNHTGLCSSLDISDPTRVVIETDGVRQGVISIYKTNPLMNVREATAGDLTMDDHGRIAIGVRHDGKPCRVRLWDPDLGALRGITAGATGAGKSVLQLLLLVGERRSGIVSWVADLQGGKSLPEAEGRVDWFAKGEDATMALLRTAHTVMAYRERESADRADFEIGEPWPLINITLDEINRLLTHHDEELKTEAAALIADIQKTGRKVGIGIRLAVQSLHLKDLGGEEAIRQQGKTGTVVLMRTLSSSTQAMGLDGIAPPGFQMANIPARIQPEGQMDALFNGDDETAGVSSAGMAYVFSDGRAEYMRTFYAQKTSGRYTTLAALFDTGEPAPGLTEGEAAAAGDLYTYRNLTNKPVTNTTPAPSTPPLPEPAPARIELEKTTVPDDVLAHLADGPKSVKDLRQALPDVSRGSITNALTALREHGRVEPVSRGVWQLTT